MLNIIENVNYRKHFFQVSPQPHLLANSIFLSARFRVRNPGFPLPEHLQIAGPFFTEIEISDMDIH